MGQKEIQNEQFEEKRNIMKFNFSAKACAERENELKERSPTN